MYHATHVVLLSYARTRGLARTWYRERSRSSTSQHHRAKIEHSCTVDTSAAVSTGSWHEKMYFEVQHIAVEVNLSEQQQQQHSSSTAVAAQRQQLRAYVSDACRSLVPYASCVHTWYVPQSVFTCPQKNFLKLFEAVQSYSTAVAFTRYLFERSEFLIATSNKKKLSVCPCARVFD